MDTLPLAATGRRTTRLGFGTGLTGREAIRLFDSAYDAGIRHFDVARSYGYGETEAALGAFLERHRGEVTVTTKYGILPPRRRPLHAAARRIAKPLLGVARRLRALDRQVGRLAQATYDKARFSPEEARLSLDESLRQLRSERVDLLLLHEPTVDDLADEGLLRFLEDSVAQGRIGAFGVGGDVSRLAAIQAARPRFCPVVQFAWGIFDPELELPASFRIHYRTFSRHVPALSALFGEDAALRRHWSDAVGADLGSPQTLSALLLKAALLRHPDAIVLFSSRHPDHIAANVRVAEDPALAEPARRLCDMARRQGAALLRPSP
jgi:D-threo-aldose 1-dehydrogenase